MDTIPTMLSLRLFSLPKIHKRKRGRNDAKGRSSLRPEEVPSCGARRPDYSFNSVSFCSISSTEELTSAYIQTESLSFHSPPASPEVSDTKTRAKRVSFAVSGESPTASTHTIESVHSISEQEKQERWYTSAQIEMLKNINAVHKVFFFEQHEEGGGDDDSMFCRTGLDFALSSDRQERAGAYRSAVLSCYTDQKNQIFHRPNQNDLARLCEKLSKAAVKDAIAMANDLRADVLSVARH